MRLWAVADRSAPLCGTPFILRTPRGASSVPTSDSRYEYSECGYWTQVKTLSTGSIPFLLWFSCPHSLITYPSPEYLVEVLKRYGSDKIWGWCNPIFFTVPDLKRYQTDLINYIGIRVHIDLTIVFPSFISRNMILISFVCKKLYLQRKLIQIWVIPIFMTLGPVPS